MSRLESTANPVLVEVTRAGIVESVHRGMVALVRADGTVVEAHGDIGSTVFPRSAYKMLQALPLIESGAADAFGLGEGELALACASHNGEDSHTGTVTGWLQCLDCGDDDFACGPHRPYHEPTTDRMLRAGHEPCRVHNTCSGKHAGFLTVARHLGADIKGYEQSTHAVQQRSIAAIAAMTDSAVDGMVAGVDGCSAPALAFPLRGLALGFARIADPAGLGPARATAAERLYAATVARPHMVAGTTRACTLLMKAAGGKASVKTGAEGVFTAAIPSLGLGIAIKIDDGTTRASECAMAAVLVKLGLVEADHPDVKRFLTPDITNRAGATVGTIRPAAALS